MVQVTSSKVKYPWNRNRNNIDQEILFKEVSTCAISFQQKIQQIQIPNRYGTKDLRSFPTQTHNILQSFHLEREIITNYENPDTILFKEEFLKVARIDPSDLPINPSVKISTFANDTTTLNTKQIQNLLNHTQSVDLARNEYNLKRFLCLYSGMHMV